MKNRSKQQKSRYLQNLVKDRIIKRILELAPPEKMELMLSYYHCKLGSYSPIP
jgi:hypothetical protein